MAAMIQQTREEERVKVRDKPADGGRIRNSANEGIIVITIFKNFFIFIFNEEGNVCYHQICLGAYSQVYPSVSVHVGGESLCHT